MTTNHRPTLEAKRGKAQGIRDTIAHSRALPQQTHLKYRTDISVEDGKRAVQELKEEISGHKRIKLEGPGAKADAVIPTKSTLPHTKHDTAESADSEQDSSNEEAEESEKDSDHSRESDDEADDSDGSDYSSSDDDETEQLMQELNKIKQEREEQKKKEQEQAKKDKAVSSNPLLSIGAPAASEGKVKKSWRNSTAFRNQPSTKDAKESSYTNNTLKSDTHKKFLSKYVR